MSRLITGVICTTPIRPIPTNFPPLGSLAIIQSLEKINVEVAFFNIDYFRPSENEIKEFFQAKQFDFVGISAVVSTAYGFTKKLSEIIKQVSPKTIQILGGNLAASAEVIMRKTYIDFCVLGDGEIIIQELINELNCKNFSVVNKNEFNKIKGIAYLDNGAFVSTGYSKALSGSDISFPDYKILSSDGSLNWFMPINSNWDEKNRELNQTTQTKAATVVATKGCVARCTFCHRWEKGFRAKSSDGLKEHLVTLKNEYNVHNIILGDENFGSDKEQTLEVVQALKELGLHWRAAGVRARTVSPELLKFWKANNAVTVIYGIESGSQTMLDVMQKNVTVEMNSNALKWTSEAGLFTVLQLVIAMPGENDYTIYETREFIINHLKYLMPLANGLPSNSISINYAQALPGTPLYEYAIQNGYVENSVEGEEAYLLAISDIDAYSTDHFINYTKQPLLKVSMWRYLLTGPADMYYIENILGIKLNFFQTTLSLIIAILNRIKIFSLLIEKCHFESPLMHRLKEHLSTSLQNHEGYFNFKGGWQISLLFSNYYKKIAYPVLALGLAMKKAEGFREFIRMISEHFYWSLFLKKKILNDLPKISLRKIVFADLKFSSPEIKGTMTEIRMGR
jgi:radical SAM superfamily enzyme YgiQ (UPF0313 family)